MPNPLFKNFSLERLSEVFGYIKAELDKKVTVVNGKGLSTNDYTTTEKNKLSGIASGAEVNVQSNWNESSSSSDAYILNKPTKLSQFTNDAGYTTNIGTVTQVKVGSTAYNPSSGVVSLPAYPTTLPASDVYTWAKASTKPSYSWSEISSKVLDGVNTSDNTFIFAPKSGGWGEYSGSTQTGAIKIAIPQRRSATMIRFFVDIYTYDGASATTYLISGYSYTDGKWYNYGAKAMSNAANSMIRSVRFGEDSTKSCVWIGETNSKWAYLKVRIRDVMVGHSGFDATNFLTGWAVSIVTSFDTVTSTVTDTSNWNISISGNCSGSSGSCTGNAASATKATQDGDGNTISSTYLKKSGGAMTGTLTTKALEASGTVNIGTASAPYNVVHANYVSAHDGGLESGKVGSSSVNSVVGHLYLYPDANKNSYYIDIRPERGTLSFIPSIYIPLKQGTIALTKDIPSQAETTRRSKTTMSAKGAWTAISYSSDLPSSYGHAIILIYYTISGITCLMNEIRVTKAEWEACASPNIMMPFVSSPPNDAYGVYLQYVSTSQFKYYVGSGLQGDWSVTIKTTVI